MIYMFIAATLLPLLDRVRGSDTGVMNRNVAKVIMGIVVYFLLFQFNFNMWLFISFVLLHTLGASIGWGLPVGAGLMNLNRQQYKELIEKDREEGVDEWYVRGLIKDHWCYGLLLRGFIWGILPSIALVYYGHYIEAIILTFAYTLAMLLGVILANKLDGNSFLYKVSLLVTQESDKWGNQEILRGAVVSSMLLSFYLIKNFI